MTSNIALLAMKAALQAHDRTLSRPFRDDVVKRIDELEARIRELEGALQNLLGVMGMQANGVLREDVLDNALRQCRRALYQLQDKADETK